jgi:hypothetical protein
MKNSLDLHSDTWTAALVPPQVTLVHTHTPEVVLPREPLLHGLDERVHRHPGGPHTGAKLDLGHVVLQAWMHEEVQVRAG